MEQRAEIPAQARCQAKSLGGGFNRCLTLGLVLILCLAASLGQEDSAVRFRGDLEPGPGRRRCSRLEGSTRTGD